MSPSRNCEFGAEPVRTNKRGQPVYRCTRPGCTIEQSIGLHAVSKACESSATPSAAPSVKPENLAEDYPCTRRTSIESAGKVAASCCGGRPLALEIGVCDLGRHSPTGFPEGTLACHECLDRRPPV